MTDHWDTYKDYPMAKDGTHSPFSELGKQAILRAAFSHAGKAIGSAARTAGSAAKATIKSKAALPVTVPAAATTGYLAGNAGHAMASKAFGGSKDYSLPPTPQPDSKPGPAPKPDPDSPGTDFLSKAKPYALPAAATLAAYLLWRASQRKDEDGALDYSKLGFDAASM
jgi:hypothetical protein